MTDADADADALAAAKVRAREAGFSRRATAFADRDTTPGTAALHLARVVAAHRGRPLAGYMPMRTEIDPMSVMADAARHGPVAVPVIQGRGLPLRFREWTPGCALEKGNFGAMIPVTGAWIVPEVLIVPLVAFTRAGERLGYGGGFYDRTLAGLRAAGDTVAIGFGFAAQEADDLPLEATDQPLDLIVTEREVISP